MKLWLAQGFLGSEGSKEMEEIGDECFDDLLSYSLFQGAEYAGDGNMTRYKTSVLFTILHDISQRANVEL